MYANIKCYCKTVRKQTGLNIHWLCVTMSWNIGKSKHSPVNPNQQHQNDEKLGGRALDLRSRGSWFETPIT